MSEQQNHLALPQGTEIGSYRIEAILGMGGFGIVYKARHTLFEDRLVAIKEFLPRDMAGRHGSTVVPHTTSDQTLYDDNLERFVKEGQTLVKLQHPNVVHCIDLFKANGTAYLFMDYEDGAPLDVLIKAHEAQGSRYTEEQLLAILIPLAAGLEFIHSREVIHRDIKPDNIFLRRADESPVIIDFGAARQNYLSVTQTRAPFTPFYAPAEQMDTDRSPRPTLDIHAFGGLMYRMVCGEVGPDAQKRMLGASQGNGDPLEWSRVRMAGVYSDPFLALIDQCLAFMPDQRPQSMAEVRQRLEQLVVDGAATASAKSPPGKRQSQPQSETQGNKANHTAREQPAQMAAGTAGDKSAKPATDAVDTNGFIPAEEFAAKANRDVQQIIAMTREGFCSGRLIDGQWYIDPQGLAIFTGQKPAPTPKQSTSPPIANARTCTFPDGNFLGQLQDGLPHGQGTWTGHNGDTHEGEWANGKRHGKGVYTWSDGSTFTGEWRNHKKHGSGIFKKGGRFSSLKYFPELQEWNAGALVSSRHINPRWLNVFWICFGTGWLAFLLFMFTG